MDNMNDIIKQYIIKTLELQQTRLKCINLGFNPSKDVKRNTNPPFITLTFQSTKFAITTKEGRVE